MCTEHLFIEYKDACHTEITRLYFFQTSVFLAPPSMSAYNFNDELGIQGEVQSMNASLAVQLAHMWMRIKNKSETICIILKDRVQP